MDEKPNNLKDFAIIFLFLQTLGSGMIPIYWGKRALLNPKILSIGNCLTAGIFLAMALSHILYEARETEEKIEHHTFLSGKLHLHIFIGTFVLIFGIEAIISADEIQEIDPFLPNPDSNQSKEALVELTNVNLSVQSPGLKEEPLIEPKIAKKNPKKSKEHKSVNFVLITGAMSTHSISTGLALGVQQQFNSVLSILIGKLCLLLAIIAHKSIEAIAIGFNISMNVSSLWYQGLLILGYSGLTPLGILIGYASLTRKHLMTDNHLLQMVAKSISAGVLFYISTVEIVNEEFIRDKPSSLKFAALGGGILFMSTMTMLFSE